MAGNTKALRLRIKSIGSSLQLTKAMRLVASSKIRKASEGMLKAREYRASIEKVISLLSQDADCQKSGYMRQRDGTRTKLVVIAGDRGLAGGYNANVFRLCRDLGEASFIPIGKRACDRFGAKTLSSERFSFRDGFDLAEDLCDSFLRGEYDRLGVVFTEYRSVLTQEAKVKWLLPIPPKDKATHTGTVMEPDPLTVLHHAVKEYVGGEITSLVRESFACEVASRRNAMDSAEKNATQMIDDLNLAYNRARQGAITQEITEIVAGSGNHL